MKEGREVSHESFPSSFSIVLMLIVLQGNSTITWLTEYFSSICVCVCYSCEFIYLHIYTSFLPSFPMPYLNYHYVRD